MRRWVLVLIGLVVVAVAGCQHQVVLCQPSPGAVLVELTGIQPRTAAVRVCRDDTCGEFVPLAERGEQLSIASHNDLPATLRLDVAVGGKVVQSYQVDELTLRKPSGKGCDPGESVLLTPAPGGRFTEQRWDTEKR